MIPELFEIPFLHVTVKSYGLMMVVGFLLAIVLMGRCAKLIKHNPEHITSIALYALVSGIIGARVFYVLHNFDSYRGNLLSVFAIWNGGLELLGGVFLAVAVVLILLRVKKLPVRTYFDILVIGLMMALAFGRVGCYLNGCCFGKPTQSRCSITFPYESPSYLSQVYPDNLRGRAEPLLELPVEYFGYETEDGKWISASEYNKFGMNLKPYELLSDVQKEDLKIRYRALRVLPAQFYSTANALALCLILYLFWRKYGMKCPGATFALMLILYGPARFFLETLRDDNPFEKSWWTIYPGGTISQNIGIFMFIAGVILMFVFTRLKPPVDAKK
jgi:phosphatidylglycerol:prolipoprotein diacylglycerol transferase